MHNLHSKRKLTTSLFTIALSTVIAFTSLPLTNVYATEKTNPTSKTESKTSNTGGVQNSAGNGGNKTGNISIDFIFRYM